MKSSSGDRVSSLQLLASATVVVAACVVFLMPCAVVGSRTLRLVDDDSGDYSTSPLVPALPSSKIPGASRLLFGNRVLIVEPISSGSSSSRRRDGGRAAFQSQEETKTESSSSASPYNSAEAELYADSDEELGGVTEKYLESSTNRLPSIPAALRRSYASLVGTTTPEPPYASSSGSPAEKPKKTKTRRRKVKRPSKLKTTTGKALADDLGIPENSAAGKSNSTGEKNLALEIGSDDGKYALINQFFEEKNDSKAPGIISYAQSQDFANDNRRTLGNLQQNEIWLSEGDLLVLKGGYYDSASKDRWPPIDSYERTKPVLRIPLDTNNPPPFPVFVNESGPPVFLGPPPPFGPYPPYPPPGSNETFDPSRFPPPGLIPLYPNGSIPEFFGPPPPGFGGGNGPYPFPPPRGGPIGPPGQQGGVYGNGGVNGPPPGGLYGAGPPGGGYGYGGNDGGYPPPPGDQNGTYGPLPGPFGFPPPQGFNGSGPPPPFYPFLPPPPGFNQNFSGGGPPNFPFMPPLVLNPADNETDDPSIFLPPPYDFDYLEDNATIVPPGPFAPGLVVPPPQDFYVVFNRTSPAPRPIITTPSSISSFFSAKRPQRPNAKKPKFPITNPPDDSLEANLPQSSPLPVIPIDFPKKRKRPGKAKSYSFPPTGPKYGKIEKDSSEEYSGETPTYPDSVPLTPRPLLLVPRTIPTTPIPPPATTIATITTTQRAINYVYVRGQLKTLAEIAAEQAVEDGFEQQSPTPSPPYDELGYPTRVLVPEDKFANQNPPAPVIYQYSQRLPTKEPQKLYYQSTPQYNLNYDPNAQTYKKKSKVLLNPINYSFSKNQNEDVPRYFQSPTPTITQDAGAGNYQQQQPQQQQQYNNPNNQDRIISQYPNTNYRKSIPTGPNYTPTQDDNAQQRIPVVVSQLLPQRQTPPTTQLTAINQPQQYAVNNNQNEQHQRRQPQSFTNNANAGFRPAFAPPQQQQQQQQQQRSRNSGRVLFPGQQISSRNPNIYNSQAPLIYQQQQQQRQPQQQQQQQLPQQQQPLQGYFSPISQYHQPVDPTLSGQFIPSTFFGSSLLPGTNYQTSGQSQFFSQPFFQSSYQQQPTTQQQYSPFIQQQQQQQSQQLTQQSALPLHSDILVNYREPLPQYNTESEAITSRTVAKAGPSLAFASDPTGAGSSATATASGAQAGSFYSFQRGGPGGFSYKIRL